MSGASRITGLLTSVMDLHVRIAMQEADKEKRRLISGAAFLGAGVSFLMLATAVSQVALLIWVHQTFALNWLWVALIVTLIDLALAGLFLRLGGQMVKGPVLPQTMSGLVRTSRALTGRF